MVNYVQRSRGVGKCCHPKLLVLEVTSSWWFRGTRLSNNIPIFWGVEKHDFTKFPRTKTLIMSTHNRIIIGDSIFVEHLGCSQKLRQAQVNGRDVSQMDFEDISDVESVKQLIRLWCTGTNFAIFTILCIVNCYVRCAFFQPDWNDHEFKEIRSG